MTGESEPQPSLEEIVLVKLGYGHCLDTPLEDGVPTIGRHFLDVYGDSPKRRDTEDLLRGFADMPETDPDYKATAVYLTRFIEPYFGTPQAN